MAITQIGFTTILLLALALTTTLLTIIVVDARKKILEHYAKKTLKKKGYGGVVIVHPNKVKTVYYKKYTEDGFDIGGRHYNFNTKRVYYDGDGFAWIYYHEGDAEPLDLLQENIPLIDGKQYALTINKAMSIGYLQAVKQEDIQKMLLVGALILAGASAYFAFTNSGAIHDMSQTLEAITTSLNAIKAVVPTP